MKDLCGPERISTVNQTCLPFRRNVAKRPYIQSIDINPKMLAPRVYLRRLSSFTATV